MQNYDLAPIDLNVETITQAEKDRFADLLIEIGAIKFGAFRLKLHETRPEAPLSPVYINLRLLRSYPLTMAYTTTLLGKLSRPLQFDLLSDIPTASTPIVAVLSYMLNRPMISPRKETKSYGMGVEIDGDYQAGQTVLLIDDLVSKADSKLEALDKLKAAGLRVTDLMMLVDRQQGGKALLEDLGYKVHIISDINELLNRYRQTGAVDEARYQEVTNYLGL